MNRFLGIVFLIIFSFSCSSDLDYNQANNLKSEPVIIANLASFDIPANLFINGGIEQTVSGDLMNFKVFTDAYFNKSLTRADLFFETNNTINRAYRLNLIFLDANNLQLFSVPIDVPAYSGVQNLVTKTEIFENSRLDLFKKTDKIAFVVVMLPGPGLSESSSGSLKLRSSSTLYLVVE